MAHAFSWRLRFAWQGADTARDDSTYSDESAQRRTLRLDLPCHALGFEAPPARLQLRFLGQDPQWTLLVFMPAGKSQEVAAWLRRHTPTPVAIPDAIAPRSLRCQLKPVPSRWQGWLAAVRVLQIDLARDMAALFFCATPSELASLASGLAMDPKVFHPRPCAVQPLEGVALTRKQQEVLRDAVMLGYYDVPHRVDLRRLGRSMDLSVSAVSQLLRRAQSQIVRGFVDAATLEEAQRLLVREESDRQGRPATGTSPARGGFVGQTVSKDDAPTGRNGDVL